MQHSLFYKKFFFIFYTDKKSKKISSFVRKLTVICEVSSFMYLRAILCTFQISVDFYFVPVGGRGGERGGWRREGG